MKHQFKEFRTQELFRLKPGDFHAKSELEAGDVPLISCGEENNGLIGYYDIPSDKTYSRVLTVAFNGFPLTTKFHPYRFGAKDDACLLIPLRPMSDSVIIYVASLLNGMRWRYSYGRKCFREKLQNVSLLLPVTKEEGVEIIDSRLPDALLAKAYEQVKKAAENSIGSLLTSTE